MDDWGAPRGEQGNVNILLYGAPGYLAKVALENFDDGFHCPLCIKKNPSTNKCLAYHVLRYWGYEATKCDQQKTFRMIVEKGAKEAINQCCSRHNRLRI
jgi:hypothetical protein